MFAGLCVGQFVPIVVLIVKSALLGSVGFLAVLQVSMDENIGCEIVGSFVNFRPPTCVLQVVYIVSKLALGFVRNEQKIL